MSPLEFEFEADDPLWRPGATLRVVCPNHLEDLIVAWSISLLTRASFGRSRAALLTRSTSRRTPLMMKRRGGLACWGSRCPFLRILATGVHDDGRAVPRVLRERPTGTTAPSLAAYAARPILWCVVYRHRRRSAPERSWPRAVCNPATANSALIGDNAPLTVAELRLHPYLQTHLTFREIGERLFVSRNTVSSEVGSIYRKRGRPSCSSLPRSWGTPSSRR